MVKKYICIHGHFYQPPRENPWTERIEPQESASPYNDWNERIVAECYQCNAKSSILGENSQLIKHVNNYSKISFNFGPTLLSWMQQHAPSTYQAILQADQLSQSYFNGHGSAIAQAYNHMIMPLANTRDQRTQVLWGIKDFAHRFNRQPQGMWLPETAVNIQTLEQLAEHGIQYTILAPRQVDQIKRVDQNLWMSVTERELNTTIPYKCCLPSGKEIVIFFYNGDVAHEVAFGRLLQNGGNFASRMLRTLDDQDSSCALAHIATDGETYGHHHEFGDMALAYFINSIESNNSAQMTVYSEYLKNNPPEYEVQIKENSSWSCLHGVERWRNHCGCCLKKRKAWTQEWRSGLRKSLDWLRDELAPLYEKEVGEHVDAPWQIRDEFISIILNRSVENHEEFFKKFFSRQISTRKKQEVMKLLEMQRQLMLMYTSCGWFFDDISGIETQQILKHAAYAIQLAQEVSQDDFESQFLTLLGSAKSNIAKMQDGKKIYESAVRSANYF